MSEEQPDDKEDRDATYWVRRRPDALTYFDELTPEGAKRVIWYLLNEPDENQLSPTLVGGVIGAVRALRKAREALKQHGLDLDETLCLDEIRRQIRERSSET